MKVKGDWVIRLISSSWTWRPSPLSVDGLSRDSPALNEQAALDPSALLGPDPALLPDGGSSAGSEGAWLSSWPL